LAGIVAEEVGKGLVIRLALQLLANVADEVQDKLGLSRSSGNINLISLSQRQKVAKKQELKGVKWETL
jgi:hypothetical protein